MPRTWLHARQWPLTVKAIVLLAVVLLPLGVINASLSFESYSQVARQTGAAMSPRQLAVTLMPLLTWLVTLATAWLLTHQLVVVPLVRMRRGVERYVAGDKAARLRREDYLSQEMTALSGAFDDMADAIGRHQDQMEEALAEQQRLTREVHHRVKNNLQIVSSLLSIQAHETKNPDVAHAYGTVQTRVNALALVHRWMYDDAPQGATGRAVDIKALLTDLCAGLEHQLTVLEGAQVHVRADFDRGIASQDTAVPLAFLLTELASVAVGKLGARELDVSMTRDSGGERGALRLASAAFRGNDTFAESPREPASRIVLGMARQLRGALRHDNDAGSYTIDFPLLDRPPAAAKIFS